MTDNRERYLQSARRAARWIVDRQRPDGSFFDVEAGVGGYYKVPYALAAAGFVPEAMRLFDWVRAHHFTAEGDFRAPSRKATLDFHEDWPMYSSAWLIQGAHRLGRFDLSFRGAEFLLGYQAACGGFHAPDRENSAIDTLGTSWAGLAELTVGNLDAARSAVRCIEGLVSQQPDPTRFYFRVTPEGTLVTDVPDGAELGYFVDSSRDQQIYFHPGIALVFLCRWHQATAEASALEAGRTIFDFTQRCQDDVYRFPPSGKLGFGSALLASITGNAKAGEAARSVADYLVSTQGDDGCWVLPDVAIYEIVEDKQDPEILLDVTAEFTAFLCEIAVLL